MPLRRKFVTVKARVETKYVHYLDENGTEVRIKESDKIPEGCRIVKWTREQELQTYQMPIEEFMERAIMTD